jgi:hypothetical protein
LQLKARLFDPYKNANSRDWMHYSCVTPVRMPLISRAHYSPPAADERSELSFFNLRWKNILARVQIVALFEHI